MLDSPLFYPNYQDEPWNMRKHYQDPLLLNLDIHAIPKRSAINWNECPEEDKKFWDINLKHFWVDTEIPLSNDILSWQKLNKDEQTAYKKILAGLTLLDTYQAGEGMHQIRVWVNNKFKGAIFSFMATMEQIHAKSYSSIFTTLLPNEEIDELFEWAKYNPHLQAMLVLISNVMHSHGLNIWCTNLATVTCMIASIFLESFLFYSGFYYPLLLAGKGKMIHSCEIINLIIRDEKMHGIYTGKKLSQIYQQGLHQKSFTPQQIQDFTHDLYFDLYELQTRYVEEIYAPLGLVEDVMRYVKYCGNQAHLVLNIPLELPHPKSGQGLHYTVNPIVLAGLDQKEKTHDFFSVKGNSYIKPLNVEHIQDEDFL